MDLIAVSGLAGSGKSEFAKVLAPLGYELVKFAGPLKAMLRGFYHECGLNPVEVDRKIEGDLKEQPCEYLCGKTPRHAMLTLGTEWGREMIDNDLWVNAFSKRASASEAVICDDLRFENEEKTIRDLGGAIVRVHRPDQTQISETVGHASETHRVKEDVAITNDGTLTAYLAKVDNFVFNHLKKAA